MDVTSTIAATGLAALLAMAAPGNGAAASRFAQAKRAPLLAAKTADASAPERLSPRAIRRLAGVLAKAVDRGKLTAAAEQLAASGQPEAVQALARFLVDGAFLRRLDALDVPDLKLANFSQVLTTLAAHPTRASEEVGLTMLADHDVQADPDRNSAILAVLASVRPMSERVEQALRQANADGYWHSDGLLLVANASPRALALFAEMAADARVPREDRVDMIRWAVPPHRHEHSVVECVALLLERGLPPEVDRALFETLFAFGGDTWFGKVRQPPQPEPWARVETSVLKLYVALGQQLVEKRPALSPAMRAAIDRTTQDIRTELTARHAAP